MTEEEKLSYGVCVSKFTIDNNWGGLGVDVAIEKAEIEILNITVFMDEGEMKIEMPENYCPATSREFKTIRFQNHKDWAYIKAEIEKEIRSKKWVMEYLQGDD